MAKQAGPVFIEGTIEDLTFYLVDGIGYVRRKSSLTGKRVKRDPKFARTMQSAERLKRGSQLASNVYRSLPKEQQVYALYKALKRMAILALKEDKGEPEVRTLLGQQLKRKNRKANTKGIKAKGIKDTGKPLFRPMGEREK